MMLSSSRGREILTLEKKIMQTKCLSENLRNKISREMEVLDLLQRKMKMSYDYIKPESEDLQGKRIVLLNKMKLRKSKEKTNAFKVLEEMQTLLDNFNSVRRDVKYAKKVLKNFDSVYVRHAREFESCEKLYNMGITGAEDSDPIRQGIIDITVSSLPTFKWECQNWKSNALDLLDRYNSLLINTRFDELMGKFDKLVAKLI